MKDSKVSQGGEKLGNNVVDGGGGVSLGIPISGITGSGIVEYGVVHNRRETTSVAIAPTFHLAILAPIRHLIPFSFNSSSN